LNENISVKAKSVHDTFLVNFNAYQENWTHYEQWKKIIHASKLKITPHTISCMFYFQLFSGIFLLIPSMFLLSNISDNGILAVQNKGFICLYLYIIFAIVFVYYNIGLNIITWTIADPEHLELFSSWKTALPPILIIMPLCACFLVLVLVHLKLGKYHGIPWTMTTVPLWIFVVLEMFCRIHQLFYVLLKHLSLPKLIGFTAACGSLGIITVLPLTLMGYAYDYLPDPENIVLSIGNIVRCSIIHIFQH
jgi:hypothetical protein